jgi:hypothetical protein
MSDVSAVVLTIGESFTPRALESIARQTLPAAEVILVENVSPFFRAMNEAVGRMKSPFFVQVDADMILDPSCFEALRAEVREDTGIVVGELRDPLLGRVVGIKLFRTECFGRTAFRDSITPDTDFGAEIARLGWKTLYVATTDEDTRALPRTLGEHRPDYTPAYTYRKHILEGCRLRYRGARGGLRWRFDRLGESTHSLATLAQVALGHGFFLPTERDELMPWEDDPDAAHLVALLGSDPQCETGVALFPLDRHQRLRDIFQHFAVAGQAIARAGAGATFQAAFASLSAPKHSWHTLVAKIALGHGMLSPAKTKEALAADERVLGEFVTLGIGRRVGFWQYLRARASRQASRAWRSRETVRW